jgi:hypothetical protein
MTVTPMQWLWLGLGVALLVAFFAGTAYAIRRRDVTAPGPIGPHADRSAGEHSGKHPEPGFHAGESEME